VLGAPPAVQRFKAQSGLRRILIPEWGKIEDEQEDDDEDDFANAKAARPPSQRLIFSLREIPFCHANLRIPL